jgi:hypothetical protein
MRTRLGACAVAAWLAVASPAQAVQQEDFFIKTAEDVIDVCTTSPEDPLYTAAVNFCQGYLVGLYQTLEALQSKSKRPLFCAASPVPTRTQAIADLMEWGKAHPQYKDENPVNFVVKFITERWPCPK